MVDSVISKMSESNVKKPAEIEDAVLVNESPEPKNPEPTRQKTPQPARKGVLFPLLAGGALAGAIGFGAALFLPAYSKMFQADSTVTDQLSAQNTTLKSEISALHSEIATLEQTIAAGPSNDTIASLKSGQDTTVQNATEQAATLTALATRIADVENRPIPDIGATAEAVATYERELTAMREMFAKELARIETVQVASTTAQVNAAIQSDTVAKKVAYSAVQRAIESGEAFASPLAALANAGIEMPDALTQAGEVGIITLAALQEQFPGAARLSLNAAIRAQADAGTTNKVTAFFRTQLGARSLSPQEGDGPDAILSRAEAALKNADLSGAIAEISALTEAGAKGMADWADLARSRQTVVDGLAELTAALEF